MAEDFTEIISKKHDEIFIPKYHNCETHAAIEFVFVPLFILKAIRSFVEFRCSDQKTAKDLSMLRDSVRKRL